MTSFQSEVSDIGSFFRVGSLIAKEVPPYTIVGGVPAEKVKKRFSEDVIEELLEMRWWNWDSEKIKNNLAQIMLIDIEMLGRL